MLNIGPGELVIIFVAALVLLGPERLPELARGIGKFLREFRRQTDDVRGMVEREFYKMDEEIKAPLAGPAPLVSTFVPPPHDEHGRPIDPHLNDPMHGDPLLAAHPLPDVKSESLKSEADVLPAAPAVPTILGFPEGTISRAGRPPQVGAVTPGAPSVPGTSAVSGVGQAPSAASASEPGSEPHGG